MHNFIIIIGNNYEVMEQIIVFQLATNIYCIERVYLYLQHAYTPLALLIRHELSNWVIVSSCMRCTFVTLKPSFICAASSADLSVPVCLQTNQYIKMIWSTAHRTMLLFHSKIISNSCHMYKTAIASLTSTSTWWSSWTYFSSKPHEMTISNSI